MQYIGCQEKGLLGGCSLMPRPFYADFEDAKDGIEDNVLNDIN